VAPGGVAVVTGGTGGLGSAVVDCLAKEGGHVVSCGSGKPAGDARPAKGGQSIHRMSFDVTDEKAVDAAFAEIHKRWGGLDTLVHCAAVAADHLLPQTSQAEWERILSTNLTGAMHCMRAAGRIMLRRRRGHIIAVSSFTALRGARGLSAYSASKAGLIGLSRSLAAELGGRGVRVNVVCPGMLDTPMGRAAPAEAWESQERESLLGRGQSVDEVAAFIATLAGMQNVSGQVLNIDSRPAPWS